MDRPRRTRVLLALGLIFCLGLILAPPLFAQEGGAEEYRTFLGLESRIIVWVVAQLHLMFGAFVLGVPLFASIVELTGMTTGDPRYDRLSHEFTRLLSAAFSTTAALGGLMTFTLFGLYPKFSEHLTGTFHKTMYVYAMFFFAEAFTLYLYYYSWDRLKGKREGFSLVGLVNVILTSAFIGIVGFLVGGFLAMVVRSIFVWTKTLASLPPAVSNLKTIFIYGFAAASILLFLWKWARPAMENRKWLHLNLGILVNLSGITLMVIANSWATYMMSPPKVTAAGGMDPNFWDAAGNYTGHWWDAMNNALWMPLNIHRLIANVAFGGFVVGAYAAVKFLGAKKFAEKAHYDWMGYIGNFVGMAALIPLPFAGYYLGREVYSYSATMGQDMMGGTFSWTFIIQAILIGMLFIGGNFYLWSGMNRIRGAEKYTIHILIMLVILVICFGIWSTPHNLPMSAEERTLIGAQFHPSLAKFGLMSAKNAVVWFIIVTTFFSFLLYRRANKGKTVPFREHGKVGYGVLIALGLISSWILANFAFFLFNKDLEPLGLTPDKGKYLLLPAYLLFAHIAATWVGIGLTFKNRGILGQGVIFASTIGIVTFVLGWYGFVIMTQANPFLREISVAQAIIAGTCLIVNTGIDIFLFRKAETVAGIRWGKITAAAQYALITLCLSIVMLMGLMGYIRSGLRKDWHIFGVMQDTSVGAYTPTIFVMAKIVGFIVILFLALIAFVFWLSSLGEKEEEIPEEWYAAARDEMEGGETTGAQT